MADNTRQRKQKDAESDQASLMTELRALGAKMDQMQTKMDNMKATMDNMPVTMQTQMDVKINYLRGCLEKLITDGHVAFKTELEQVAKELHDNLDLEVGIMSTRMEKIETKLSSNQLRGKPFDPKVSPVVVGLPESDGKDVEAKVKQLLRDRLRCDPVPKLVATERVRARGRRQPGLVKVELEIVQDEVAVLRTKSKLKDHESYERVFVSSAKSQVERLMEFNLRTLLREIPAAKDNSLAGNGRLVGRTEAGATARGPRV